MTPEDQKRMDEFFATTSYDKTLPWQQSKEAAADPDDDYEDCTSDEFSQTKSK